MVVYYIFINSSLANKFDAEEICLERDKFKILEKELIELKLN